MKIRQLGIGLRRSSEDDGLSPVVEEEPAVVKHDAHADEIVHECLRMRTLQLDERAKGGYLHHRQHVLQKRLQTYSGKHIGMYHG